LHEQRRKPTPTNYTFKIADTTTHDIENVTAAS